jgi:TPR repeat protein
MNIEKLIIKANKGNIKAIKDLADKYYFGDKKKAQSTAILPKDANKAFEWWKIGADMGDESCLTALGYCYHMGDGVKQNNLEAKNCWEKAAKKGSNGAYYNLAVLYANGWGVSKDSKKAIRYYKKNIKKKNDYYDMSLLAIARHYFEGLGINKNIKKGTNLYEQAAKIGNLRAMFELAHMFDEYNSFERYNMVKKNNDLAIKYYIQLAKNNYIFGHYAAMQILREEIKKYRNVKKNIKKFNLVIRLLKKYKDNIQKIDEEFESKSAKMNFTREQIIKQRINYNDLRDKSLVYIDEIKEISLKENA